jgi:hypothetical protein
MADKRPLSLAARGLTRPESATSERLAALACPCLTVKLDGVRCALTAEHGRWRAEPCGAPAVDFDWPAPLEACALDCEFLQDSFYVFDALEVLGRDVRRLPLLERLAAARLLELPPAVIFKRFYVGFAPEVSKISLELLASRPDGREVEGLVIGDLSAPYETAPAKFKPQLTHDFLVTRATSRGALRLHVQFRGQLQPFCHRLAADTLRLSNAQEQQLLPSSTPALDDAVVLECVWDGRAWAWRALRRRSDRTRPNTATTVLENLRLQAHGFTDAAWFARQLPDRGSLSLALLRLLEASARLVDADSALVLPDVAELKAAMDAGGIVTAVVVAAKGLERLKKSASLSELLAVAGEPTSEAPALEDVQETLKALVEAVGDDDDDVKAVSAARRFVWVVPKA